MSSRFSTTPNRWISKAPMRVLAQAPWLHPGFRHPGWCPARCTALRHLGWHGGGQSSSLQHLIQQLWLSCLWTWTGASSWTQQVGSVCVVIGLFPNMLLFMSLSLVLKSKPLLEFSLSLISCVSSVGLFYHAWRQPFQRHVWAAREWCGHFATPLLCSSTAHRLSSGYFLKVLMSVFGPRKNSLKGKL